MASSMWATPTQAKPLSLSPSLHSPPFLHVGSFGKQAGDLKIKCLTAEGAEFRRETQSVSSTAPPPLLACAEVKEQIREREKYTCFTPALFCERREKQALKGDFFGSFLFRKRNERKLPIPHYPQRIRSTMPIENYTHPNALLHPPLHQ